jgi:hypothetical protein
MPPTIDTRISRTGIALAALLFTLPLAARAQADSAGPRRWELRITGGALLPTGDQRHQLKRASLSAIQVSWLPRPSLALTGTLGRARSRDLTVEGSPRLDAFAVDLGVEARPSHWVAGRRVSVSPFVGVGGGARSYDYRARHSDARHNLAGYASLGGELGVGRVGLRVEARQYLGRFAPMAGTGPSDVRGDVLLMTALRFNRRAVASR